MKLLLTSLFTILIALTGQPLLAQYAAQPAAETAQALKLATIFGDHMVLQQGKSTTIFGNAAPNADVKIEFAGQSKTGKADANGEWAVDLDAP